MKLKDVNKKIFARNYVETSGDATAAVSLMYPGRAKDSCAVTGHRLLNNIDTQEMIINTMERRGITDDALVLKLKELLNAQKSIVCDKQVVKVEDNGTVVEALKMSFKLKGHLDAPNVPNLTIGLKIESPDDIDRLERIADRLERLADRPLYTAGSTVDGEIVARRKEDALPPENSAATSGVGVGGVVKE
jgi:hypothetical protein